MTTINGYSTLDNLSDGDQLLVYSSANSDTRKTTVGALKTLIAASISARAKWQAMFLDTASSANIVIVAETDNDNIVIVENSAASPAACTVRLPGYQTCGDGKEVLVFFKTAQDPITLELNGATALVGTFPATAAAGDVVRVMYLETTRSWYVVS